ncbi:MAG TPA: PIG-L deacetylase family protein [archaeon]|nr:PIG-L deacetylase family protein [archaeon]
MKLLVFSAHPDDADFVCGATVAKKASEGHEVHYVVATGGQKGNQGTDASPDEFARMRENEERRAAAMLGVRSVTFLNHVDGELEDSHALRSQIVKAIREIKPDILVCMDPALQKFDNVHRYHRDHRMMSIAVFDAGYPAAGNPNFYPEAGKPWAPKEFWFFGGETSIFEDVTGFMDTKIKALTEHKSQVNPQMDARIREWASENGKKAGFAYAEGFRVVSLR